MYRTATSFVDTQTKKGCCTARSRTITLLDASPPNVDHENHCPFLVEDRCLWQSRQGKYRHERHRKGLEERMPYEGFGLRTLELDGLDYQRG